MDNEDYNQDYNFIKEYNIKDQINNNNNLESNYFEPNESFNENINQQNDYQRQSININQKLINKINYLYNLLNLFDNLSLYDHKDNKEKSNIRTNNITNLLLFIFSGFNIKLKETPNMNNIFSDQRNLEKNIYNINLILVYLNSKFLIKNNISSEEYALLTVYFIDYFDLFKNLLDFLKNKQNESLFSWNNLFLSLNDDNESTGNEFNICDNLKRMEQIKSNSVLESYNKLHFIMSNIKTQLDILVNQIFKLNEIKINQSLGRYKLEELILFSDNKIFENYKQIKLFSPNNIFINKYLENIIEALKIYPDIYDSLIKESKNFNLSNEIINKEFYDLIDEKNDNNKVDKTKLNIIQKLIEIKFNLNSFDLNQLKIFFNELQNKINLNIANIKNKNAEIINGDEFSNMLNNVLSQLQNYINKNIIDLSNMMQSNNDIDSIMKDIEMSQRMFLENNNNIWDKYSQYLFSIKEYLELFYKKNMLSINRIIKIKEDLIKKDYNILNKEK